MATPCVHTWASIANAKGHIHACAGQPGCHDAPCRCACGAQDFCTLNRELADTRTKTAPFRHQAAPPRWLAAFLAKESA